MVSIDQQLGRSFSDGPVDVSCHDGMGSLFTQPSVAYVRRRGRRTARFYDLTTYSDAARDDYARFGVMPHRETVQTPRSGREHLIIVFDAACVCKSCCSSPSRAFSRYFRNTQA
jgi:hypothetical protein